MKYKIYVFLFFIVFGFYVYLGILNPDEVKFYFGGQQALKMSVGQFVVIAFALGIIVSILVGLVDDIKKSVTVWKKGKRGKRKDEFLTLIEKAKSYDLKGDRDKAIEQLNRIILRAPDIEEGYTSLAKLYASSKEYNKAIEILDLAETHLGKKESILLKKVKIRTFTKEFAKQEADLKEILKYNETNFEALGMLRDLYISQKRWDDAYDAAKRIVKFIKTPDEKRRLLGIRYEKASAIFERNNPSEYDSIVKELKDIISEDKRFIPAYVLLAEIYKKTNKLNEAGRVYGR